VRALLATSQVTFVPRNYDDLVVGLADCPQIAGLLEIPNGSWSLWRTAWVLWASGARGIGRTLLVNQTGGSWLRRRQAYAALSKPVWAFRSINSMETVELVHRERIDLVINARTREIYRAGILGAPRLGCVNIHHGLLPDQRGVFCDLWALHEHTPAGFTVHVMAPRVDAGAILQRVQVSDGSDRDFLSYLERATWREAAEMRSLLSRWEREPTLRGEPNQPGPGMRFRRNPSLQELRAMRKGGLRV
jgi:hypothetical protein